jgi:hypothetical protein
MSLAGTFQQYPLPDVLGIIEKGQRSGRLVANGAGRVAHVYIASGQWVHAERLGMGLSLAEQLVNAGLVNPQQLASKVGLRLEDTLTLPDAQFVRMLTTSDLLTQQQLHQWVMDDAVTLLAHMLTWTDGEFHFEDGVPVPAGQLVLPLPLTQLLGRALQTARGSAAGHDVTPAPAEVVIAFADIDASSEQAIQLTRDQWRLLSAVDGQAPLWAIARALQAPEPVLLRAAAELVAADIAVIVGRVPPGR